MEQNICKLYNIKQACRKYILYLYQVPEVENEDEEGDGDTNLEASINDRPQVLPVHRKQKVIRKKRVTPKLESIADCLYFTVSATLHFH